MYKLTYLILALPALGISLTGSTVASPLSTNAARLFRRSTPNVGNSGLNHRATDPEDIIRNSQGYLESEDEDNMVDSVRNINLENGSTENEDSDDDSHFNGFSEDEDVEDYDDNEELYNSTYPATNNPTAVTQNNQYNNVGRPSSANQHIVGSTSRPGNSDKSDEVAKYFWENIQRPYFSDNDLESLKKFLQNRSLGQKKLLFFDFIMGTPNDQGSTSTDGTIELKNNVLAQLARKEPAQGLFDTVFNELNQQVDAQMVEPNRGRSTSRFSIDTASKSSELSGLELAWRTQINVVTKISAVLGNTERLQGLIEAGADKYLSVDDLTTSALWAIKFNHPEAAKVLYTRAEEKSKVPDEFQKILKNISGWAVSQNTAKLRLRRFLIEDLKSQFSSPQFTNYFDGMGELIDEPFEDSQDDILNVMVKQTKFKNVF
ncbi:hypothetical protein H4R33_005438 [Dimargaris cristalligena]|nr:hypothetical protein H4R33_005438 [Dimargaris cristalligena]